jgi:hypothetical protein
VIRHDAADDAFTRLHRSFTFHLGVATALAWSTASVAALYAPWVRNIRPFVDPLGSRVESTASFLFVMPCVLALAWLASTFGRETLRQFRTLPSDAAEFALAGLVAFGVFYLSIDRAVSALLIGG